MKALYIAFILCALWPMAASTQSVTLLHPQAADVSSSENYTVFFGIHPFYSQAQSENFTLLTGLAGLLASRGGTTPVIERPEIVEQLQVFPNPASDHIRFDLNLKEAVGLNLRLYRSDGIMFIDQDYDGKRDRWSESIDLGQAPAGLYKLVLREQGGGVLATAVVMKAR